ncbi:site-specific integrase [Aerococcaceae bacterium NML190073]|nr:site-specific integrase [Aerococcaceae bacterium NML190073]
MPKIPHVYQDKKSGLWYFVASLGYDEHGKRIQHWGRGFKTQIEAKKGYESHMNDFSDSAVKKNSTMSYREFYETYFKPDYKQSVKPQTFESRLSSMEIHLKYFFNRKLKDISAPMVKKWQNNLSSKYSSGYVRAIHGLFQKSLDLAIKLGLIQKNIAKQVGNVKKVKKKVDFWTKEEAEKVFSTFDSSDYYDRFAFTLIYCLFMTGLRIGEAQALNWADIDFKNKTLEVNKNMYYKTSKEFYITEPKTLASNRVIALDGTTLQYLSEWKEIQGKNIITDFVFSYNGLPTNKSTTSHIITRHSKLAGVHRIKTHALRHSHASLLISLGENALVIRDRLGHEDIKTTLGTYGHLYPNMNREVAKKLTNIFEIDNLKRKFKSNQYVKHDRH